LQNEKGVSWRIQRMAEGRTTRAALKDGLYIAAGRRRNVTAIVSVVRRSRAVSIGWR